MAIVTDAELMLHNYVSYIKIYRLFSFSGLGCIRTVYWFQLQEMEVKFPGQYRLQYCN